MEETTKPDEADNRLKGPTEQSHLPTPALSPIDERGEHQARLLTALRQEDDIRSICIDGSVAHEVKERRQSADSGRQRSVSKLSPRHIDALVTAPDSLPIRALEPVEDTAPLSGGLGIQGLSNDGQLPARDRLEPSSSPEILSEARPPLPEPHLPEPAAANSRPGKTSRSASSPLILRKPSASKMTRPKPDLPPLQTLDGDLTARSHAKSSPKRETAPSPTRLLPLPPLSLPAYLQLELSAQRPSELYIHRPSSADVPYESSKVKFERLVNFLLLPPSLEQVLWFGAIACLDAWLYTFTILPLRFLKALAILVQWWGELLFRELLWLSTFVYAGVGRVWRRNREASISSRRPSLATSETSCRPSSSENVTANGSATQQPNGHSSLPRKTTRGFRHHRRSRSIPSTLLPDHKADLLRGLLILASCTLLLHFDASRMYHSIRGQSAIKLYVIYNVLEVFDKLFSALGQDILEVLFSPETLERGQDGRSKVLRPFWLWILALAYVVIHATALFYQVVTLNVAVNSYSNALLTLLMSNQFVEIKGTVFKKFEKENLFQLTCADVVERFQLWLMLLIIALRNIVEVGGLSISLSSTALGPEKVGGNGSSSSIPLTSGFAIPAAFTILPKWTGELLTPFLIVLGSEALVDWCKHAYIGKFNQVRPAIYSRFLDVLAKDYYSHAFVDQNLMKRLGLPVIPLSCLFIRACLQTYRMFLATHVPIPVPSPASAVSLETVEAAASSAATTAAIRHIDHVFRRALGRSSFGVGDSGSSFSWWSLDDVIAFGTMVSFFLAVYLMLLAFKLMLGMLLLSYARGRYRGMKERERMNNTVAEGKRAGTGAMTEVGEEKRKWIYEDDVEGLRVLREKEERGRMRERKEREGKGDRLEGVDRYFMAAKRIW